MCYVIDMNFLLSLSIDGFQLSLHYSLPETSYLFDRYLMIVLPSCWSEPQKPVKVILSRYVAISWDRTYVNSENSSHSSIVRDEHSKETC